MTVTPHPAAPLRVWRRIRRLRRSNIIPSGVLIIALVLAFTIDFDSEKEVFETPTAADRSPLTPLIIPAGEPIALGYSGPLTGPLADLGSELANAGIAGALYWQQRNGDTIHGHPLLLVGEDDSGTEVDIALDATELMLARPGLVLILGPAFSTAAGAAIDAYAQAGVVMVSGSATRTDLTLAQEAPVFFFRATFTNAIEGPLQAELLAARIGMGAALVVDDGEAYGVDLAGSVSRELAAAGWAVERLSVPQRTVDFSAVVLAVASAQPDAVVFEGFNPEAAILLRQLRDAGYDGLFLGGDGVVSQTAFVDVLGPLAEGALLTGCPPALTPEFDAVWEAASPVGQPTTAFAGPSADAAYILVDALNAIAEPLPDGSLRIDPMRLRDAVAATDTIGWATGQRIAFDAHGDRVGQGAAGGLVACEVRDGAFVEVTS